jgi:hypothetical protein
VTVPVLESDLLPPVAEIVGAFAAVAEEMESEHDSAAVMDKVTVMLPVEFEFWRRDAALELRASPPTQKISTTILPVWHRIAVTVALEETADAGPGP